MPEVASSAFALSWTPATSSATVAGAEEGRLGGVWATAEAARATAQSTASERMSRLNGPPLPSVPCRVRPGTGKKRSRDQSTVPPGGKALRLLNGFRRLGDAPRGSWGYPLGVFHEKAPNCKAARAA